MTLSELQYELDGFVFGRDTVYTVEKVDFGKPELSKQDKKKSRADGRRFGRDYKGGRTITFDLNVLTTGPALDALDVLAAAWDAEDVRTTPGAAVVLRWVRGGRARRVWGRPRDFASVSGKTLSGWVPVTATFDTEDANFYTDEQSQAHVTLVPRDAQTGITVPLTVPFQFAGESITEAQMVVGGEKKTPIALKIHGPVTDPTVEIPGAWSVTLTGSIAADDWVLVDPMNQTVLSRFGEIWAGEFTKNSQHLPDIALKPGTYDVVLRGTDNTGTASLDLSWHNAHSSY